MIGRWQVTRLQQDMRDLGMYEGAIDGDWGPLTEAGYNSLITSARSRNQVPCKTRVAPTMAWGRKVSPEFKSKVAWISDQLGIEPDWLMACIAFESGETFDPGITNGAGSGATGLIQFMPATARALGTTVSALAKLSPEQQLDYVHRYFIPYRGRIRNLGDLYMAILWPAGIGKPDDWVMWQRDRRPTTYRQNAGLDSNQDNAITRGEAIGKIMQKLERGLSDKFRG
jgi:hypothetical protein